MEVFNFKRVIKFDLPVEQSKKEADDWENIEPKDFHFKRLHMQFIWLHDCFSTADPVTDTDCYWTNLKNTEIRDCISTYAMAFLYLP